MRFGAFLSQLEGVYILRLYYGLVVVLSLLAEQRFVMLRVVFSMQESLHVKRQPMVCDVLCSAHFLFWV